MSDKPPFTLPELDAGMRHQMYRHVIDLKPLDPREVESCAVDGEVWPCSYLVNASISLKLSALIAVFQADAQTISLIGGLNADSQKGQRR